MIIRVDHNSLDHYLRIMVMIIFDSRWIMSKSSTVHKMRFHKKSGMMNVPKSIKENIIPPQKKNLQGWSNLPPPLEPRGRRTTARRHVWAMPAGLLGAAAVAGAANTLWQYNRETPGGQKGWPGETKSFLPRGKTWFFMWLNKDDNGIILGKSNGI